MKSDVSCLADSVKFVESMNTGGTGHTIPVVASALAPAV